MELLIVAGILFIFGAVMYLVIPSEARKAGVDEVIRYPSFDSAKPILASDHINYARYESKRKAKKSSLLSPKKSRSLSDSEVDSLFNELYSVSESKK